MLATVVLLVTAAPMACVCWAIVYGAGPPSRLENLLWWLLATATIGAPVAAALAVAMCYRCARDPCHALASRRHRVVCAASATCGAVLGTFWWLGLLCRLVSLVLGPMPD